MAESTPTLPTQNSVSYPSTSVAGTSSEADLDPDVYAKARESIDKAHRDDPAGMELAYADNVEKWMKVLVSSEELTRVQALAARCQVRGFLFTFLIWFAQYASMAVYICILFL